MFNRNKKGNYVDFKNEKALHESSNVHESKFNKVKKYYASIFYDGTSNYEECETTFLIDATRYFESIARLNRGHVEVIRSYK